VQRAAQLRQRLLIACSRDSRVSGPRMQAAKQPPDERMQALQITVPALPCIPAIAVDGLRPQPSRPLQA
jgi:hypothetical protein